MRSQIQLQMLKDNIPRKSSSYEQAGTNKIIIGIAGGSAAGKTTLCENITRQMAFDRNFKVQVLSLDCFYRSIDVHSVDVREYNFDHPDALDFDLAYETLVAMKKGKQRVPIPQYSFVQHRRLQTVSYASPANIIFFEGLMAFYDKRIRDLMTYKIFIHCDDDIRLCRRLKRDTTERGRTVQTVLLQYNKFVKKAYRDFIYPSLSYADLIIPGFRNNRVSVDFIVQHIKNIAKHMNFKEQAIRTKIYCFGENQYYDLEYKDSNLGGAIEVEHSSFLVFPTAEEQKKELAFFLSDCLLSDSFSYEYFVDIYSNQFSKILKTLFNQLIELKQLSREKIELYSIYDLNQLFASDCHQRNVKVILLPAAINIDSKSLLTKIKDYVTNHPKVEIVLLNIFSDMGFPSFIYKLQMKATVLINLFIVTNQRRFSEIMTGNAQFTEHTFSWLIANRSLTQLIVKNLSESLHIQRGLNSKNRISIYEKIIKAQPQQLKQSQVAVIMKEPVSVGKITQLPSYPQEHHNLCGYHTLNAIMCEPNVEKLLSKQTFIENYHKLKKLLIPLHSMKQFLKYSNYESLQRKDLEAILHPKDMDTNHELFKDKSICCLYYGFGYVQNSRETKRELYSSVSNLLKGKISELFIVMAVIDHYFLVKLSGDHIYFVDSLNTPLQEIMKIDLSKKEEKNATEARKRGMREALEIVCEMYFDKRSIYTIEAECKIQEIIGSYYQIPSNDKAEQERWFKEEYTPQVIKSDLYSCLSSEVVKGVKPSSAELLKRWQADQFVSSLLGSIANISQ